jgi:hypothetical protein
MCAKCGVDISATNSTNITATASHASNAVITTTTTNNNNNVGYIYNCNRVIVTLAVFYHMSMCIQANPLVKLKFFAGF